MTCAHATLKRLNGGRCPRCDDGARAEIAARLAEERRQELIERARQELERATRAKVIMARRSLAWFVRLMWPVTDPDTPLEWNWHHDVLCRHLQYSLDEWRVRKRHPHMPSVMQNVCCNIGPGTAKSRILSVMAPAWMWLDSDGWRVTCVSSNDAVVARDHEMCGKVLRSPEYQDYFRPGWTIEQDNARVGLVNTRGGQRLPRTFFAGAVGLRGDALFFDDIDDPARVKSAAYRAERDRKWSNAWFNRVNDDRIAVRWAQQQRVDPQDHTSTLLGKGEEEEGAPDWAQLVVPLHWRPGLPETPIGTGDPRTEEGEILHPARFTPRVIRLLRRALGEAGFDQQYDQRSTPKEAKMFPAKWWRFFQRSTEVITGAPRFAPALARPERCVWHDALVVGSRSVLRRGVPTLEDDLDRLAISVDASFAVDDSKRRGDGKSRDGLGVIGKRGHQAFVYKDATKRRAYPELKRAVKQLINEWPQASELLIEKRANGAALIGDLLRDPELREIQIIPIEPTESKRGRAVANQPAIEDGAVMLLDGAPWLADVVDEHERYEGRDGDDSDRVDWIGQALRYWADDSGGPWWMREEERAELGDALIR